MTRSEENFIDNVKHAIPDSKDNERVEKILSNIPGDAIDPVVKDRRSKKAILQLNRISDFRKFYRRVKAFIDAGIVVDFTKCKILEGVTTVEVTEHLNEIAHVAAECMTDTIDYDAKLVL